MHDETFEERVESTLKKIHAFYNGESLEFLTDKFTPHCLDVKWLGDNDYRLTLNRLEFGEEHWYVTGYVFNDFVIIDDDDIIAAVRSIIDQYNGNPYTKDTRSEIEKVIDEEKEKIKEFIFQCNDCHEFPDVIQHYHAKLLEITLKCPKCGLTIKEKYIIENSSDVRSAFKDIRNKWDQQIYRYIENDLHDILETANDTVNHPSHYTQGGIECIDAMRACMTEDGFRDYCKGNILKYIWRYRDKNGVEDLKKAQWYLNKLISTFEGGEK